jgi:hypothetical protein
MTLKLQEKPSALKRDHPALKKMKILSFFLFLGSFWPSWIRIRIRNLYADPDPDPAAQINADPDPDPKPWVERSGVESSISIHASLITYRQDCGSLTFWYRSKSGFADPCL